MGGAKRAEMERLFVGSTSGQGLPSGTSLRKGRTLVGTSFLDQPGPAGLSIMSHNTTDFRGGSSPNPNHGGLSPSLLWSMSFRGNRWNAWAAATSNNGRLTSFPTRADGEWGIGRSRSGDQRPLANSLKSANTYPITRLILSVFGRNPDHGRAQKLFLGDDPS